VKPGPVLIVAVALLLGACAAEVSPSIVHAHGDVLAVNAPPNRVACDARFRAETEAAQRIRRVLTSAMLPTDGAAVEGAAVDPKSTTDLLGIPLTVIESNMVRASGIELDGAAAIGLWVTSGAPERFGGIWIDPPLTDRHVVAIVGGDQDAIGLARCLERVETRYVWANLSLADGEALKDEISLDGEALRASGIEVNSIDYEEVEGTVIVGVTQVLPGLAEQLIERYGGPIRVVEEAPSGGPLGRHGAGRT
jgi:hypothetical protein